MNFALATKMSAMLVQGNDVATAGLNQADKCALTENN
jgi:hypothetical protein